MIDFSHAGYVRRTWTWTNWKAMQAVKGLVLQYEEDATIYSIWGYDGPEVHLCTIYKGTVPDGVINTYDQETNDADKQDFETNSKSSGNAALLGKVILHGPDGTVQQNEDKNLVVSTEPRLGTELILCTPNFCDPTTWYYTSERITDEALTDSGDGLLWTSAHTFWIDLSHGKIFDEDALCADVPHGYAVIVTVDGVEKTARDPFADSGGDYVVDYVAGTVTFASSQSGNTVVASYSRMVDSTWVLAPDDGYRIDIESAEAQFSENVVLNDTVVFDIYVYNPYDLPNKVLYARSSYKRMVNYIDEAEGSYPVIPPIGGPDGRGTASAIYGFPFRYGTVRKVLSSQGTELRVSLQNHQPFSGEHATATFYCTVRAE